MPARQSLRIGRVADGLGLPFAAMWKPNETFRKFEDRLAAETKPDFARNLQMVEAMYEHAVLLYGEPRVTKDIDIALATGYADSFRQILASATFPSSPSG